MTLAKKFCRDKMFILNNRRHRLCTGMHMIHGMFMIVKKIIVFLFLVMNKIFSIIINGSLEDLGAIVLKSQTRSNRGDVKLLVPPYKLVVNNIFCRKCHSDPLCHSETVHLYLANVYV
jgi:hypothetical protein